MMRDEIPVLTSGRSFGHYQLRGEIGYGGMGAVYRAQDARTGQVAAVKLLPPEYLNDLGLRSSFEREAQLVAGLDHEAIVPVYEFGEQDGQPFIVMQYMANGSLADRLLQGPLSPDKAASILDRVCQAIDYAHERGIIHLDLKPSNILFDDKDRAYLADFGIARQAAWQTGAPISGTPAYLSPEQAVGEEDIGGQSDIYSLGIILFEILTGQAPFAGETPLAVMLQQVHDQPPSLRAANQDLPGSLDTVIQRALAKNPADRFPTARELSRDLRAALAEEGANQGQAGTVDDLPGSADPFQPAPTRTEPGKAGPTGIGSWDAPFRLENPAAAGSHTAMLAAPLASPGPGKWRFVHFASLALATVFAVMFAAALAAFLQLRRAALPTVVQMTFDSQSFVLTNFTDSPLDLSGLVFRRIAANGAVYAEFPASRWAQMPGNPSPKLQPAACFELLRPGVASVELGPRITMPLPQDCGELQGWLVALEPGSAFWIPEDGSPGIVNAAFQVVLNGSVVQTCAIEAGSCRFSLAQP